MSTIFSNNFYWKLRKNDTLSREISKGKIWEPHILNLIRHVVKPGDTTIDIGACFGWHTLEMSRVCGEKGKVYSFEPQEVNYSNLQENIKINNIKNVISYETALGHKDMQTCLCYAHPEGSENFGDSFISPNFELGIKDSGIDTYVNKGAIRMKLVKEVVPCMILDNLGIEEKVKFIKLDVQGFEMFVLQGAEKLIQKSRPIMVIEFEDQCMNFFNYTSKELFEYIKSLDYEIYFLDHDYPCDHVCIPNELVDTYEKEFENKLKPHTHNNPLNNNYINGIRKMISFR